LTSTSPRIREILTVDGGLERLVRMLRDFCASPPPPVNPRQFYGLLPPQQVLERPAPIPSAFPPFDRAAAHRFSLAFQCVVNVGVRGSESIRSRVVQAGMLQVVGAVLEAWLISKGFAVGPSSTGSGAPRESRHTRHARKIEARQEDAERRQRGAVAMHGARELQAADLARALQEQVIVEERSGRRGTGRMTEADDDADTADTSAPRAPSSDALPPRPPSSSSDLFSSETSSVSTPIRSTTPAFAEPRERSGTVIPRQHSDSPHTSRGRRSITRRRPGEETDDTEVGDTDDSDPIGARHNPHSQAVAVVDGNGDSGIDMYVGGSMTGFDLDVGVDQAMVNLEHNDGLAMGAPPGAPGAANQQLETTTPRPGTVDVTPRAALATLADDSSQLGRNATFPGPIDASGPITLPANLLGAVGGTMGVEATTRAVRARAADSHIGSRSGVAMNSSSQKQGPYKDEDVLLSLQLLAYLSKYPYVRQAFYKPRPDPMSTHSSSTSSQSDPPSDPSRPSTNIFSLVERFTFRPSPSEPQLPRLPNEIQYWAGVIMRNACRKDESRGGIRQCANMTCGKWEKTPREFAKCRRCRKAKYCGKECQSRAWAEGHRFWCSARDPEEEAAVADASRSATNSADRFV
jgi:MYND finger